MLFFVNVTKPQMTTKRIRHSSCSCRCFILCFRKFYLNWLACRTLCTAAVPLHFLSPLHEFREPADAIAGLQVMLIANVKSSLALLCAQLYPSLRITQLKLQLSRGFCRPRQRLQLFPERQSRSFCFRTCPGQIMVLEFLSRSHFLDFHPHFWIVLELVRFMYIFSGRADFSQSCGPSPIQIANMTRKNF